MRYGVNGLAWLPTRDLLSCLAEIELAEIVIGFEPCKTTDGKQSLVLLIFYNYLRHTIDITIQ